MTFEELKETLSDMSPEEVFDALDFDSGEDVVSACEDYISDFTEEIEDNLRDNGVI